MNAVDGVIYLCRCAVNEQTADKDIINGLDLNEVYKEAKRHMITSIVGIALQNAGVVNEDFKHAVAAAQRKTIIIDHERSLVYQKLDEAGIWHMTLKGSVIKDWYPEFGMRESADCDILFDSDYQESVRDIMTSLGFTVEDYGRGHHDVYFKKPVTNMQMHISLFGVGYEQRFSSYYDNVKERLVPVSGYEYTFAPNDFYVYIIAHENSHFVNRGSGLRALMDTFIILNKLGDVLDWDYIVGEMSKLDLLEFEQANRSLAMHLFGEGPLTEGDKQLLEYVSSSGAYGSTKIAVNNHVEKYGGGLKGKFRYIFRRIFADRTVLEHNFPFFYKHKILLPFLPIYRIIVYFKSDRKRFSQEWSALFK